MNYLQLVQRLNRESGRSNGQSQKPVSFAAADADDLRMMDWVSDAWTEVERDPHPWKWRRASLASALIIGTKVYSAASLAASDLWRFKRSADEYDPSVYITGSEVDEYSLSWMSYDEFRSTYILGAEPNGRPLHWSVSPSEELLIGPAPDVDFNVRFDYYTRATELAVETDTPTMPSEYHALLVWRALMDVASADAAPEVYSRAQANYKKVKGDLDWHEAEPAIFRGGSLA